MSTYYLKEQIMRWKQEFTWLKQWLLKLSTNITAYTYKDLQMLSVTGDEGSLTNRIFSAF